MFQLNTSEASCGIPTFVGEKLSMGVSALVFFFLLPLIAMAWENDFQKAKAYYSFIIVSLVLWVIWTDLIEIQFLCFFFSSVFMVF